VILEYGMLANCLVLFRLLHFIDKSELSHWLWLYECWLCILCIFDVKQCCTIPLLPQDVVWEPNPGDICSSQDSRAWTAWIRS